MPSVLIVRPSSLGDIVHAMPIVHDLATHRPGIAIDWVAEEAFAALVRLNRGVRRVIPIALRRWRHRLVARSTWEEFGAFRRELEREHYDAVIDLQEQVKGAFIAWLARGPVHGPDRASVREPIVTLAYRHRHAIDPAQHLIDRCRALAGKSLGYEPEGAPRFDLDLPPQDDVPDAPYAVLVHATSRDEKLWPEAHWKALLEHALNAGFTVVLPWGDAAEKARSARIAEGARGTVIPPRRTLPELAALLARAEWVVGVDTGLTHLAAALGTPTVAIFTITDPRLAGVARAGGYARDLGVAGTVATPAQVIAALGALLRTVPS
ncbi:MAG TPA: lipopolysaccharide heptosyltransferase I [Casimicrobiaceae bacterium]